MSSGDGVVLLIQNPLKYEFLATIEGPEGIWCKLFLNETILVIGIIYRPPSSSIKFIQKLDEYLMAVTNSRSRIVVIGDFNLPGVDWDAKTAGQLDRRHADSMLEIMAKHGLVQVVRKPTRIQAHCESTLDLVILSDDTFDYEFELWDRISDHKVVVATL